MMYEARLTKRATRPKHKLTADGFVDAEALVRSIWREAFSNLPRPDTDANGKLTRQFLRRRDAWFRKHPLHDWHVRAFLAAYPPTRRTIFECTYCGKKLRLGDRPVSSCGERKNHCGCRTGVPSAKGRGKYAKFGVTMNTAEGKRLARLIGAPGYKQAKHDAHVKEFAAKVLRDSKPHSAHVIAWYEWRRQQAWYPDWKKAAERERARLKEAAKMATDMGHRLNGRMRVAIRKALGGKKAGRRWEAILGYTMDQLREHFAKQLPKKMTVEDALKAGWHIDHIVPKSLYDLEDEAELKAAWCMSNLRLIPAHENHSKHARRVFLL